VVPIRTHAVTPLLQTFVLCTRNPRADGIPKSTRPQVFPGVSAFIVYYLVGYARKSKGQGVTGVCKKQEATFNKKSGVC
jgi:hypothetical protein